ncbi:hypothetical protein NL676_011399 [Syzygium grande]|nr:hypothetical protein NL676_011399 [Syzygium grande]
MSHGRGAQRHARCGVEIAGSSDRFAVAAIEGSSAGLSSLVMLTAFWLRVLGGGFDGFLRLLFTSLLFLFADGCEAILPNLLGEVTPCRDPQGSTSPTPLAVRPSPPCPKEAIPHGGGEATLASPPTIAPRLTASSAVIELTSLLGQTKKKMNREEE